MVQQGLWNLVREKVLQDRGALPKEEGDVIREYTGGRVVTSAHFGATFHDTSLRGRVCHSTDSARRDVAWPALSPDLSPNGCILWGFQRDSRCITFAILSSLSPFQQNVSSHSMADSRDKLHLARHHPIHAQNFTIRSHSTAQVPCSCLASTCSDLVLKFSTWKVAFPQFPSLNRLFVPDVTTRPPSPHLFLAQNDVTTRPPCKANCHKIRKKPNEPSQLKRAPRSRSFLL